MASSFVFSKTVLDVLDMVQFGFVWFGVGSLLNLSWLIWTSRKTGIAKIQKGEVISALIISVLEGFATVLFYYAIQQMENPAVVSFIGDLGPVLVTIMGVTLLGEKYGKLQVLGILLALGGVGILTFRPGTDLESLVQPGSQYVVFASVLFAIATIYARKNKQSLNPELMSTIRSFMLFAVFAGIVMYTKKELYFGGGIWMSVVMGSLLETLITIVFAYQALRFIEAAKTSLIISTKAVFALFLALVFLDAFPSGLELTGGALSLSGIMLIGIGEKIGIGKE